MIDPHLKLTVKSDDKIYASLKVNRSYCLNISPLNKIISFQNKLFRQNLIRSLKLI